MKWLAGIAFCAIGVIARAQPVITASQCPEPGDVCEYMEGVGSFVVPTGAMTIWDFSSFLFEPSDPEAYLAAEDAPGYSHFPEADLAETRFGDYWFYRTSPEALYWVGHYRPDVDVWATVLDTHRVMVYPSTIGTSWTDVFESTVSDVPGTFTDTVTRTAVTYGTVIWPGQVVENVLVFVRRDTVDFGGGPIFLEFYRLVSPWSRCDVARVTLPYDCDNPWLDPCAQVWVLQQPDLAIADHGMKEGLDLWPTPANDVLNVRANRPLTSWSMLDATGRMVRSGGLVQDTLIQMDVHDLTPGGYVLRLTTLDGGQLVRSFLVE
jgi:hypothetical protein